MKAINNTESRPKNFYRLYHLIKQVPEYREIRDGAGRSRSNADILIRGWIWQSTNEEKYLKRELTLSEYTRICNEIEKKYNLRGAVHRNKPVNYPGGDKANSYRSQLLAAVHENLSLRGYEDSKEYNADRHAYAVSIITRDSEYEDFNKIPVDKLRGMYASFLYANKMLRKQRGGGK